MTAPTTTSSRSSTALPPRATPTLQPLTPTIVGGKAEARLVLSFFNALDAGQMDAALAQLADDAQIGDCDLLKNQPVVFGGKEGTLGWVQSDASVNEWLRERIADNEQFILRKIWVGDPSNGYTRDAVGVDLARRTNDSLRRIGYPNGITKNLGAKVILTADHKRIMTIALGPGFDSNMTCYEDLGITRKGGNDGRSLIKIH